MKIARVLVTAFAPWGDRRVNASELAVKDLDGTDVDGARLHVVVLPVEPLAAHAKLLDAARSFGPDAVVSFGMHRRTPGVWLVEMLARNRFSKSDILVDAGAALPEIAPGRPRVLSTGLPIARIHGRLLEAGLPVEFSEDAGTFVCNQLFYRTLLDVDAGILPPVTGFVHVPPPEFPEGSPGTTVSNKDVLQEGARVVLAAVVSPMPYARDASA